MSKPKIRHPAEETKSKKDANLNTRGKNAAGQTQGQNERDPKRRHGNYGGAGDAPRMTK